MKPQDDLTFNPNLLLQIFKNMDGAQFIGIREYENANKGISNYTILVNASYARILENDLKKLQELPLSTLKKLVGKYGKALIKKHLDAMILSLQTRMLSEDEKELLREQGNATLNRSDAQKNAYDSTDTAMKAKDEIVHITGLVVAKQVIKMDEVAEGKKPSIPTVSALAKKEIEKLANLTGSKYRTFKINQAQTIVISKHELMKTS